MTFIEIEKIRPRRLISDVIALKIQGTILPKDPIRRCLFVSVQGVNEILWHGLPGRDNGIAYLHGQDARATTTEPH